MSRKSRSSSYIQGHARFQNSKEIWRRKISKSLVNESQQSIDRMMKWGVKIVDFGIDATRDYRSFYYLMETIVTTGYKALQIVR